MTISEPDKTDVNKPTAEDLARDLATDLKYVNSYGMVSEGTRKGWSASIRRALFAEAEVKRLQGIIDGLTARVAAQSELLPKKAEGPC